MPRLPFGKFFKKSTISADSHVAGDDGSYVRCYDMKAGDKMEPGLRIGSLVPDDKPEITVPDETMTSTPSQLYAPPVETETMDITSPPVEMKAMELENIAPLPGRKTKNKYFLPVVAGLALLSGTAAILAVSQALTRQEALNAVQAVYTKMADRSLRMFQSRLSNALWTHMKTTRTRLLLMQARRPYL